MRSTATLSLLIPAWLTLSSVASAQLPTATGREVTLGEPGWKLFLPDGYRPRPGGGADLLVHFHGDPSTVRNNAEYAGLNAVIVTVNYNGLSSVYSGPFSDATRFDTLLDQSRDAAQGLVGFPLNLHWNRVGVSSFSAGYGAVRELLKSADHRDRIDALVAADSLYATTAADGTPLDSQMAGYKAFADLAAAGQKSFLFSHSRVPTPTYESTEETGDELLEHLGLAAEPLEADGLGDLHFYRYAERGGFRLWGATGADGDAHLAHLRYLGEFLKQTPLAAEPLPEPASFGLLLLAVALTPSRRRRLLQA